ncbi:transposase [Comamonas sp. B21-038]|uniref:transposase n=1 Tax=Comamonas sp. B21-038 TaxID=2918299 RepID=UPI002111A5C1|nr:transposase [Comamonas sp. B21-038]
MSGLSVTPKLKEESVSQSVRQAIERGYWVAEAAARLGISTHSLYKWLKTGSPGQSAQHFQEGLEAGVAGAIARPMTSRNRSSAV